MRATPTHLSFLDPDTSLWLVEWGGWILFALGVIKMLIWLTGEFHPTGYQNIKSDTMRKILTGGLNRLIFGLGGFLTAVFGAVFVVLARVLARFAANL